MSEEYQKTIILLGVIAIFSAIYASTLFDRGTLRENNIILFAILFGAVMVGYLQTKKIKEWEEDESTDYSLVYGCYLTITTLLFFYLVYMVITRSELECMRILRINLTTGAYKVYYGSGNVISNLKRSDFLENIKNTAGNKLAKLNSSNKISEVNVSSQSNNLMDREEVIKNVTVSGAFFKIFNGYKKIWKKILFIKD